MEMKEYYIGIDYGTSNSCIGVYMNSKVNIAPNKIGERTTPSIVLFSGKEIFIGEETINQKIEENNLIYEVKRFIGLDYGEFIKSDFSKDFNYDIINQEGQPKIKVMINGLPQLYSAQEISSLIIRKMVSIAEDFINEFEKGVKINKAVITVPVHFTEKQKNAIETAARLANIQVTRIINEPTAAALAYGLGEDIIHENEENSLCNFKTENLIVFDLGGGTFDVTFLKLTKDKNNLVNFEIIGTKGDKKLGGSDFDNRIVDYCIKKFCEENDIDENEIRNNQKLCKRLKIKCESAKKLLSESNEVNINLDNFYKDEYISIKIKKNYFEELCKDLFEKIKLVINELLKECKTEPNRIDFIILVGGATRITGIKDLLINLFGERKIKDSIDPDEAVAFGATLQSVKLERRDKMNFNLQDIIPYNLGIAKINNDINNIGKGQLMYTFIKKYSKIPATSDEKELMAILSEKNPNININIYEGNDKYVENNKRLDVIIINDIKQIGNIKYKVKFILDVNCKLTVKVNIDSLHREVIREIKNVTNAIVDMKKKKLKINKSKSTDPIKSIINFIGSIKGSIYKSRDIKEKIEKLIDCSHGYEKLIKDYKAFSEGNYFAFEKMYLYTKKLFDIYTERILLKSYQKDNIEEIITQIKEKMNNLISTVDYVIDLLDIFLDVREKAKDEYYIIFTNFMELMNNEGNKRCKNIKYSRYYSKLYFEKAFYCYKKYIRNDHLKSINRDIKRQLEEQQKINKNKLNEVKSFAVIIENLAKGNEVLIGNKTGFTLFVNQIEKLEKIEDLTVDEVKEFLDLFQNMADSYEKKEKCIEEAYCIANIIKISYNILKNKNIDKLMEYIYRLEDIMKGREDEKYKWYTEIKDIINEIKKNE